MFWMRLVERIMPQGVLAVFLFSEKPTTECELAKSSSGKPPNYVLSMPRSMTIKPRLFCVGGHYQWSITRRSHLADRKGAHNQPIPASLAPLFIRPCHSSRPLCFGPGVPKKSAVTTGNSMCAEIALILSRAVCMSVFAFFLGVSIVEISEFNIF
jgi:hypothetical protein